MKLNTNQNKELKRIHILFGESAAGTMKVTISEMGLHRKEQVICFNDIFSIGPIWQIHKEHGLETRINWFKQNMNEDFISYLEEFKEKVLKTINLINRVNEAIPITIWVAENAQEQTGLRFALYLLREKGNEINIINTTNAFKHLFLDPEIQFSIRSTGEASPDKLRIINEKNDHITLTQWDRKKYETEWLSLSETRESLRVWQNGQIKSVSEDYFDQFLIKSTERLHKESNNNDFMKSARVLGEVIGIIDEYIVDFFLEYRLRKLNEKGIFDVEGDTKAMRYYRVKLT